MSEVQSGERGAAAITVAISLLVLMAFAALAMDGGLGFDDRRGTQNAADNAALAAAWEACNPSGSTPEDAGLAVAAENGYDNTSPDTSVQVNALPDNEYEVIIQTSNDATFARAGVGADSVSVTSRAVADCEVIPFLGGYALFAGAPSVCSGGVELDLTGASKIITGGVHSNGALKIQGAATDIDGPITYVGSIQPSDFPESEQLPDPLAYPIDLDISEFAPGGSRANNAASSGHYHPSIGVKITNTWMTSNGHASGSPGSITITRPGIYYTDREIDLNNATVAAGVRVTFVSKNNQIKVVGSGNFDAYEPVSGGPNDPGVLMFSTYDEPSAGPTCSGNAIQWSVSSGVWTGVIYAPNGQARQSSASSATLNGSIFAYTINLSGSSFQIDWLDNPDAVPDFKVELKE